MTDSVASTAFSFPWLCSVLKDAAISPAPPSRSTPGFSQIGTDSRKVAPGELFVALVGDHFDGHGFLEKAVAEGAAGVIAQRGRVPAGLSGRCTVFEVDDTLIAYRELAAAWRSRFDIPVIGIAGSVGKTTTKELLAALLSQTFAPVLKTEGSENGFIGIPKTLLRLTAECRAAVIEIGIDDVGAMQDHLEVVRPTHGILTVISEEHLEKLRDLTTILAEERKLLDWLEAHQGTMIFNADDKHLSASAKAGAWEKGLGYSLDNLAGDERMVSGSLRGDDSLEIRFPDGSQVELLSPLPGQHNLSNLLGAAAVAWRVGVKADRLAPALSNFVAPQGRSVVKSHPDGMEFIFDYYNANPSSMKAALELLHRRALQGHKRSRACLADMLELGDAEEALHRGLAPSIIRHGIERVWLFGPRMEWLHDELIKREFRGELRYFYEDAEKMKEAFQSSFPADEVILVKGSRGMKMERLTKDIRFAAGDAG